VGLAVAAAKSEKHSIERFYTDEIVIGLCGPVGVNLPEIARKLSETLSSYSYASKTLKMSGLIEAEKGKVDGSDLFRKRELIARGNQLREETGRASFLAEKAIEQIFVDRNVAFPDGAYKSRRHCFIIDSIKNQAEAKKFREVYGSSFYLIGVFSSRERKKTNLTHGDPALEKEAIKIIEDDYSQKGSFGQQVGKVFQTADYFFRLEGEADADSKVQRLVKLILGAEIITPSNAETAMFMAASASRNSACLSRQVGAAIAKDGAVVSTGWNDVPMYGGGTYTFGGPDARCFNDGKFCRNDQEKGTIINEIVADLIKSGAVNEEGRNAARTAISNSRVSDLIEFSRAVHAEMHAILNAAKSGSGQLKGAILYCTTYPCHSCARHIVAAGITEVYFIEPYAKSKAVALHADSITEDENIGNKLKILAYEGVAPGRFLDFFSIKNDRKIEGKYVTQERAELKPQVDKMFEAVHTLEAVVAKGLQPNGDDNDGEGLRSAHAA
jgi:deoxycytidylate deaminase